ncbi:MAG: hypothetical protein D6807_00790 [Alphaproteobacteria bacterium]|nr:MAG: hypothetical protein D6807_00790 [Alphaproteobacteria bacterium]
MPTALFRTATGLIASLLCSLLVFPASAAPVPLPRDAGSPATMQANPNDLPRTVQPHQSALGITPWPVDMTEAAVLAAYEFVSRHATLIVHQFDNGVPWKEALADRPFPRPVEEEWETRRQLTPEGMPVFLALTPLDMDRSGLAPFWDARGDGQPLDREWSRKRLDDPDVKAAYLNYVRRAVARFHPRFLAIGVESNILISKAPEKWSSYLALNAHVYKAIKREHPGLPVFATIQYEHLRGIDDDAKPNLARQEPGVRALLAHSDLMALSTYRFGIYHPNPMRPDYFSYAESFGRPVAIAEMGALSAPIHVFGMDLDANEQDQANFIAGALSHATKAGYPFVVNWVGQDFGPLVQRLPPEIRDLAALFAHMGLATADGRPKPALAVWDAYVRAAEPRP